MLIFCLRRPALSSARPIGPLTQPEDATLKVEFALFRARDHAMEIRSRTRSEASLGFRRNDRDGNSGAMPAKRRAGSAPEWLRNPPEMPQTIGAIDDVGPSRLLHGNSLG
jgi:hypothetical protein